MHCLQEMSSERLGARVTGVFVRFRGYCSKYEQDAVEELIRRALRYDQLLAKTKPPSTKPDQ